LAVALMAGVPRLGEEGGGGMKGMYISCKERV
jgi:hypothetical protein